MTATLTMSLDHLDVLQNAVESQCSKYESMIRRTGNKAMREHLRAELRKTEWLHDEIGIARANARIA